LKKAQGPGQPLCLVMGGASESATGAPSTTFRGISSLTFDSFVIDHDRDRRIVVISIFQITISPRHGGSADGYHLIRKIMIRVGALLKEAGLDATIKVAYFLVHPDSKPKHKWEMPAGWNKNNIVNNHCGEAFCIPVPVPAFPQM